VVIVIIVGLAAIAGGVYFQYLQKQKVTVAELPIAITPPTQTPVEQDETVVLADISDWQTYRNEKHEFEVKHPPGWIVTGSGPGEGSLATGNESVFVIKEPTSFGVVFLIREFGSDDLGTYLNEAKNLDEFVELLERAERPESRTFTFEGDQFIDGKMALKYRLCYQYEGSRICAPKAYFQEGNYIYEVDNTLGVVDEAVFDQILSTFKFTQ